MSNTSKLWFLVRILPKKHLSHLLGFLASVKLPRLICKPVIKLTASLLQIDLQSSVQEITSFKSVQEMFTRSLKPELRPIAPTLSVPVDGTCLYSREFKCSELLQIKDTSYSFNDLLGLPREKTFSGFYYHFYLSPKDYHHIHSPCNCSVRQAQHFSGELWPVNLWSLTNVKNLFIKNERVVLELESTLYGTFFLILVGATNVGSIRLSFEPRIIGNSSTNPPIGHRLSFAYSDDLQLSIKLSNGERVGTFMLGSTVLLCFLGGEGLDRFVNLEGQEVKYGQSLLKA
jgi:phosphatidylserine decarboxylase